MPREFTLGVEEEFQIIDPQTRELKSLITQLIEAHTPLDEISLQPELHQSVVEVATGICDDVQAVRREVCRNRRAASRIAQRVGVRIGAASTHPFSSWEDQQISNKERYLQSVEEMQDAARGNLIFGLHVHVGIEDRELAMAVYNSARYFLPHLLALSTSSPFWMGRDTGLKSYRTTVFRRFPRTGIPDHLNSWSQYEQYVEMLVELHCIDNHKKIWWDIRPQPTFGTLEFRICDVPTNPRAAIAIAAVAQAIIVKLYRLRERNLGFRQYHRALIEENKWRAARWGIDGKLIDFGKRIEVPMRELALELLAFVDDVLDDLDSRREAEYVKHILADGTSAERQLQVYRETGDLRAVVRFLVDETRATVERGAHSYHV